MTETVWRQSILNGRHRELGSKLEESWNNMAIPQHYATCPYEETGAVRYKAGLIDVSALKIINVSGKDALAFINQLVTADIAKVPAGRSMIASLVDDNGGLIDDVLIYVDGPENFRLSHGGGALEEALPVVAKGFDVTYERDDDIHILSLQGPKALDILAPHTPMDLKALPYFGHGKTTLFGVPVSLARGGYSAERGYEVFCAAMAAVDLWDNEANTPDAAPAIWEDIAYKHGFRLIPETITAGLAFSKGEKGWWQDELYESLLAANVWNPSVNPDGWKKITEEGT